MSKPTLLEPGNLYIKGKLVESEVPVEYIIRWIKDHLEEFGHSDAALKDRILVVKSETGSGKSTVLPVEIFRLMRDKSTSIDVRYTGKSLICTQPRVLTTVALANDITSRAWNPDMVLDVTVGYQTMPMRSKIPSGLIYATAGTLAAQLQNRTDNEIMEKYKFILIDEAHERSVDGDMMLMLLKYFYLRNAGTKKLPFLLLMSATFNADLYASYFDIPAANIIEVKGRTHPITIHWPKFDTANYVNSVVETVAKIVRENDDPPDKCDILIFSPGASESAQIITALGTGTAGTALVLNINSDIITKQADDFKLIFKPLSELPQPASRRIIVATVVAETGLTINTLKYVIDCGWNRTKESYYGIEGLITRPAPKSRIKQRMGRVGRLFPGEFYPLYTEEAYNALEDQQLPDIFNNSCGAIILGAIREQQQQKLTAKILPEFKIEDIMLLDPPSPQTFILANATANVLGFVHPKVLLPDGVSFGYGLTPLGEIASRFTRTPMHFVRLFMAGYTWNVAASDLLTIAAMSGIALPNLFKREFGKSAAELPTYANMLRESLPNFIRTKVGAGDTGVKPAKPPSEEEQFYFREKLLICDDFVEAILIYDLFLRTVAEYQNNTVEIKEWCEEMLLDYDQLIEIAKIRDSIAEEMLFTGLNAFRADSSRLSRATAQNFMERVRLIKQCLYEGLIMNIMVLGDDGKYYTNGREITVPPLFSDELAARLAALDMVSAHTKIMPKYLVTDMFKLVAVPKKNGEQQLLYRVTPNLVSVLDGYVSPDIELVGPK